MYQKRLVSPKTLEQVEGYLAAAFAQNPDDNADFFALLALAGSLSPEDADIIDEAGGQWKLESFYAKYAQVRLRKATSSGR